MRRPVPRRNAGEVVASVKLPKPINQTTGEPSWRWRRIAFFGIVGVSFLHLASLGIMPSVEDTEVNKTIVESAYWLMGIAFLGYSGIAAGQDIAAILTTRSGRPYADNVQSTAPAPAAPVTVVSDKTTVTGAPVVNTQNEPPPQPGSPE
jgi:hypothetical protein